MPKFEIKKIKARWVLDSRGFPTVEADVWLDERILGRAMVPSGASTGINEAIELRDGNHAFGGRHVTKAVKNVNTKISSALLNMNAIDQASIDTKMIELDNTPNKSNLGANAILSVSWAVAKAAAAAKGVPLYQHIATLAGRPPTRFIMPLPMCNVINAGKHGVGPIAVQEFMLQPFGASYFTEGIQWISEIYHILKRLLKKTFGEHTTLVGDEGGFSGIEGDVRDALNILSKAVEEAGYQIGSEITFALDPAASEFFNEKTSTYFIDGKNLTGDELMDFWAQLVKEYPITSIEDGFAQDDWDIWAVFTKKHGDKLQIVGDDAYVTNKTRIECAIKHGVGNALLLKCNQIGTLSEAIEAFNLERQAGNPTIVSHRSGETEDTTISHLAVGLSSGQIKAGSVARSDRNAKYNELIRIEEELGDNGFYAGKEFRTSFLNI
ncbi:MAG: phosphopyruvate hydratase [Candidatus Heimdallarchaeota archaeon]